VRAVTDTTGTVVRTHDYHPFGEGVGVATGTDPVRFTGKPRDAETGLDYFGARYYAQGTGRFTTVDPVYTWNDNLSDPQLWNRYIYAKNNPSRFIDPDGRCVYPGADCLQYLIGGAKSIANLVPAAASMVNEAVNLVIGPVTDFRFGEAPRFEATNEDQRRGMIAADITMLAAPLASAGGASIDKWSRIPQSLMDELVLGAAQRGAGVRIIENLGDAKFKGMEKWSYSVESAAGIRSEVHYVRDPKTGHLMDFKFVHHGVKK
jgi:RHS repeat-associated protein